MSSSSTFPVTQDTSATYKGVLKDDLGNPVPGSTLASLTLTLTDIATGGVINTRNVQDVLNKNGVTIDESGNLTWDMAIADNPIVTATLRHEEHVAIFKARWGSSGGVTHGVIICVENVAVNCYACRLLND